MSELSPRVGVAISAVAAAILLILLHRALAVAEVAPDLLLLRAASDLEGPEQVYLLAVAAACAWAVVNNQPATLERIQLYALGVGLFLTQYRLGQVAEKVDPRVVLAIVAGVASLYSCYLCLLAHAAIALRRLVGASAR
ncbi:MAG TPA: hypothetical protein VM686_26825 [Polyangiaceae bacterium]|jgi:hypothetical protein|nr:hypothetical protein [Polyangiaceae bacterium]